MIRYIPQDFLGLFTMAGSVPLPIIGGSIGIGQLYNIFIIFIIIFILIKIRTQQIYYKDGLIHKYACYIVGGKTGKGKTRFMTQTARDCKTKNTIVIANYLNGYTDIYYASLQDFLLLQTDIQVLAEHQNFDKQTKENINKKFPGYFNNVDIGILKKIKGNYEFLTLGDEFYGYFHNRGFMTNFKGEEGKNTLLALHQTRHSKQTLLLASQDADNLDLDFRQLAHGEIEVKSWFLDLFYGFNMYKYLTKKEIQKMGIEFHKINKLPYFFFNFYNLYNGINGIYIKIQKLYYFFYRLFNKNKLSNIENMKLLKSKVLDYDTRFNVKTNINIYNKGDLFKYILDREKKNKKTFDK